MGDTEMHEAAEFYTASHGPTIPNNDIDEMAAANAGQLFGSIWLAQTRGVVCATQPGTFFQVRGYAARKGTRERARKAKVKIEVKKVGFIPHNQRAKYKNKGTLVSKWVDDSWKQVSTDNVWVAKYYKWKVYPFAEAVQCHRETHHPSMLDFPNAPLMACIELNMQGPKKTKFVERFTRTAALPHPFEQKEEKSILALCKGEEFQQIALEAGADKVGGAETIKEIMSGKLLLNTFTMVIAHPNILPELVALRGLMKKSFPNMKDGNLSADMQAAVQRFKEGVQYQATRDEREPNFGKVEAPFGTLDMDTKHLEENFTALLNDINVRKPKREGSFITRALLFSDPSPERLKIDFEQYLTTSDNKKDNEDEEDDEDEPQAATSSN